MAHVIRYLFAVCGATALCAGILFMADPIARWEGFLMAMSGLGSILQFWHIFFRKLLRVVRVAVGGVFLLVSTALIRGFCDFNASDWDVGKALLLVSVTLATIGTGKFAFRLLRWNSY